jgi:hypothetical protein
MMALNCLPDDMTIVAQGHLMNALINVTKGDDLWILFLNEVKTVISCEEKFELYKPAIINVILECIGEQSQLLKKGTPPSPAKTTVQNRKSYLLRKVKLMLKSQWLKDEASQDYEEILEPIQLADLLHSDLNFKESKARIVEPKVNIPAMHLECPECALAIANVIKNCSYCKGTNFNLKALKKKQVKKCAKPKPVTTATFADLSPINADNCERRMHALLCDAKDKKEEEDNELLNSDTEIDTESDNELLDTAESDDDNDGAECEGVACV